MGPTAPVKSTSAAKYIVISILLRIFLWSNVLGSQTAYWTCAANNQFDCVKAPYKRATHQRGLI